jgi:hypothetical protein
MEKNTTLLGYQISGNTPPRKKKGSSSSSVVWTVIKGVRDQTLLGPLVRMATEGGGNGTDIHTFTVSHTCVLSVTHTHTEVIYHIFESSDNFHLRFF